MNNYKKFSKATPAREMEEYMLEQDVPEGKALILRTPHHQMAYYMRISVDGKSKLLFHSDASMRFRLKTGKLILSLKFSHRIPDKKPDYEVKEIDVPELRSSFGVWGCDELPILDEPVGFLFDGGRVLLLAGVDYYQIDSLSLEEMAITFEEIQENIEACFKIDIDFDKKPHISCKIDKLALSRVKQELKINLEKWKIQVRKIFDPTGIKEIV